MWMFVSLCVFASLCVYRYVCVCVCVSLSVSLPAGITVLLSLTVFMLLVAEIMPATSDSVPLIGRHPHGQTDRRTEGRVNTDT